MSKEETEKIITTISPNDIKGKTLFEKIKILQSLPDEIIYEFMNCKGSLCTTNYKNKIFPNAK